METWDAIRARRDVRRFTQAPLRDDDVEVILEAGRRAPSSRNTQPWDFVLVSEREQLERLASVWQGAWHVAGSAAAIALVIAADAAENARVHFDLGQATMSMMLAATDRGIGSAHAGVRDHRLAQEIMALPEDRVCAYLISLGHPRERPLAPVARPDRRPFDDVVHRGRW